MSTEHLSDEQVVEIYELTMSDFSRALIGREYGVTTTDISLIKTGKIHFDITQFAMIEKIKRIVKDQEVRSIPGFDGYFASYDGRIISARCGYKILKSHKNKEGYLTVLINQNKRMKVHRLVLMAFKPETFFVGAIVMHMNGKRADNRVDNLKWGTRVENNQDVIRVIRGKRHLRLTPNKVRQIRFLSRFAKLTPNQLADKYKVSRSVIMSVIERKSWKNII